jgi:hypothetical protein
LCYCPFKLLKPVFLFLKNKLQTDTTLYPCKLIGLYLSERWTRLQVILGRKRVLDGSVPTCLWSSYPQNRFLVLFNDDDILSCCLFLSRKFSDFQTRGKLGKNDVVRAHIDQLHCHGDANNLLPLVQARDDILLDQHEMSSLFLFMFDVYCPFEARAPEYDAVYTSSAATVFRNERFCA